MSNLNSVDGSHYFTSVDGGVTRVWYTRAGVLVTDAAEIAALNQAYNDAGCPPGCCADLCASIKLLDEVKEIPEGSQVPFITLEGKCGKGPLPASKIAVEKCTGPFLLDGRRRGWYQGWSPVYTDAVGTQVTDWLPASTPRTTPNCLTDAEVTFDMGGLLTYMRAFRMYNWFDWRLLDDGVPVITETYDGYDYNDERNNTGVLHYEMEHIKTANGIRLGIAGGSVLAVEVRMRWRVIAETGGVGYARFIAGLRHHATINLKLRDQITGVSAE